MALCISALLFFIISLYCMESGKRWTVSLDGRFSPQWIMATDEEAFARKEIADKKRKW
jgi:hypothetical protein